MTRLIILADNASFREVLIPTSLEPLLDDLLTLAAAEAVPPVIRPPAPTVTVASTSADGTPSLLITIPSFTPLPGWSYAVVAVDADGAETLIASIESGGSVSWSPASPTWAGTIHLAASYQEQRVLSL